MLNSKNAIEVIARCGGYFKGSILKDIINPPALFSYLKSRNELKPLFHRPHYYGELTYYLPPKYVVPYWNYKPHQVTEYSIFRSFALIRYYKKTRNLPYARELLRKTFPKHPRRTYNGVYATLDAEQERKVIIIVDYYRTEKKLLQVIDVFRAYFELHKNPLFHIVTPKDRFPLQNDLDDKRPTEPIRVFSFPELRKIV